MAVKKTTTKKAVTTKAAATETPKVKKAAAAAKPVAVKKAPAKKAAVKAPAKAVKSAVVKPAIAAAPKTVAENPAIYIVIDHPTEGEIISGMHYAIRIGASDNGFVEISFDGGEWQPCRSAAGYWWYDWGYFSGGEHTLVARIVDHDGKEVKRSAARKCQAV